MAEKAHPSSFVSAPMVGSTASQWCRAPLISMPQDKLPGIRHYCDHQPSVLAAVVLLGQLRNERTLHAEVERAARVNAFLSKLPPTG